MSTAAAKAQDFQEDFYYVWDAEVAVNLRRNHRIMGAMLGTAFGFEQGNCDLDLPLQLSPYEASLVLEHGWLGPAPGKTDAAAPDAVAAARDAAASEDDAAPATEAEIPEWKKAVLGSGARWTLPMTSAGAGSAIHSSTKQRGPLQGEAALRLRRLHIVFRDLHSRGFFVTGGHKFGGDFLCYQGDPCLFHAQYCVRVQHHMDVRSNVLLAAARRGALGAKKHFLVAEVVFPEADAVTDAAIGNEAEPYIIYHNLEQNGVLGPTQDVVLTAGDYNSKLFRVCS